MAEDPIKNLRKKEGKQEGHDEGEEERESAMGVSKREKQGEEAAPLPLPDKKDGIKKRLY